MHHLSHTYIAAVPLFYLLSETLHFSSWTGSQKAQSTLISQLTDSFVIGQLLVVCVRIRNFTENQNAAKLHWFPQDINCPILHLARLQHAGIFPVI